MGVLQRGVQLLTDFTADVAQPTELWIPLRINTASPSRGSHGYYAVARMAPGASPERVTAELATLTANLTNAGLYPRRTPSSARSSPQAPSSFLD